MKNYTITVNGTAYQVTVEEGFAGAAAPAPAAAPAAGGVTITSGLIPSVRPVSTVYGLTASPVRWRSSRSPTNS